MDDVGVLTMLALRPHDLVWVDSIAALDFGGRPAPDWIAASWDIGKPLVVRRDRQQRERVAVGIRGRSHAERFALWATRAGIVRSVAPEQLVADRAWERLPPPWPRPIEALIALSRCRWPFPWGVTGSCGYTLATGEQVLRPDSDLDLLLRAPTRPQLASFAPILDVLGQLPVPVDIQLETPAGGVAFHEWRRSPQRVLVKGATQPFLSADPWAQAAAP